MPRYLRIDISSAYKFDSADTFAYATVGEVVVETVPADPGFIADLMTTAPSRTTISPRGNRPTISAQARVMPMATA